MLRVNANSASWNRSSVKFRKLRKKLAEWNIMWDPSIGRGSHGAFVGLTRHTRIRHVYLLPRNQQEETAAKYIKVLRRQFELLPEHGIDDAKFFS